MKQVRAVIIVVNKWDAVEKDEKTMKAFEEKFVIISYS